MVELVSDFVNMFATKTVRFIQLPQYTLRGSHKCFFFNLAFGKIHHKASRTTPTWPLYYSICTEHNVLLHLKSKNTKDQFVNSIVGFLPVYRVDGLNV